MGWTEVLKPAILLEFTELFESPVRRTMELLRATGTALSTVTHAAREAAPGAILGTGAEVAVCSAVEALLESLFDSLTTLSPEVLRAHGTLLVELTASKAALRWATGSLLAPHHAWAAHRSPESAALKLLISATHLASERGVHRAFHRSVRTTWTLPAELAALGTTLGTSGSGEWSALDLDPHFTRFARVPFAAAVLWTLVGVAEFDDVFALGAAGLGKGGGGQEA